VPIDHSPEDTAFDSHRPALRAEQGIIWTLWLTYGAFYFCRTNIAAATSGMEASVENGGLGLSSVQVGYILGSLKIAYGLGQAINGQFAERISPRVLLSLGMFGSAILNILFGLGTGFYFLLFVWAANGYFQSLGWTPCMRVAANWIPVLHRGRAIGLIGTGYQVTLGLTFLVSGWAADSLGWRGAFYVPAVLLAAAGVFMLVFLKDAPDAETTQGTEDATSFTIQPATQERGSFWDNVLVTLGNPSLWLLGLSLGLLNACRYGFIDWGLKHLIDTQDTGVGQASLKYAFLPLGAILGAYYAGLATDRFFGGRRAPVICLFLVALSGLAMCYSAATEIGGIVIIGLLILIGFCIYGPQVLLVGTAPADLARKGTAAAAAGFVNFLGYMGAAAGDVVTGHALERYDWKTVIYIWAAWALAAAFAAALLWNRTAHAEEPASTTS
jgi:sugar phosphate permease